MGRIQSQFGLVTGTDILGTVDQLIAISAQPRDRLLQRNANLAQEQQALAELTASVIGVQLAGNRLSNESAFVNNSVDVSNSDAISATAGGEVTAGDYQIRTLQTAATQRTGSARLAASSEASLGFTGTLSISPSGFLDQQTPLSRINSGRGIENGNLRITDRSGTSADIEIQNPQSIDDVLDAINAADIGVRATTSGNAIELIDTTDATDSNLIVQQLGDAETAADLGLWGIDVAATNAVGNDLVPALSASTPLSAIGDGITLGQTGGSDSASDLDVTLSDGTTLSIDFGDFSTPATTSPPSPGNPPIADPTLGDVAAFINDQYGSQLSASVTDGVLAIEDLSGGSGSFTIRDSDGASAATDLGLLGDAAGGTISSTLRSPPLRGTRLESLDGGSGISGLTDLDITLADGTTSSVDLSGAETTDEIIDTLNAAGLSLIARLNDAGNGIRIRDVSGGTGNFTVSSVDDTAARLGLDQSVDGDILVGEDLALQTVNRATRLDALNQGTGIDPRGFTITDSSGQKSAVNLTVDGIETVGELIDRINGLAIGVRAEINQDGDGIAVIDTAGGDETLVIEDTGSGTAARDLGIAGTASDVVIDGVTESALVGSDALRIDVGTDDSLADIVARINDAQRYVTASIGTTDDGGARLVLTSNTGGAGGRFAVNTQGFDLGIQTTTAAQDAVIAVSVDGGSERLLSSADGVFTIDDAFNSTRSLTSETALTDLAPAATRGSFTIADSDGNISAVNLTVDEITTVGGLVDRINSLGLSVNAAISDDGQAIELTDTGTGGETLTVTDVGNANLAEALGLAGQAETDSGSTDSSDGAARLRSRELQSSDDDGTFSVTVKELSSDPINVRVAQDNDRVMDTIDTFIDQYNNLVDKVESVTFFNADENTVGLLFGSSQVIRITSSYERIFSGNIAGAGEFRSATQVGINFDGEGKLKLDRTRLRDALENKPEAVQAFFTAESNGLVDRLSTLADQLAGVDNSVLSSRRDAIQTQSERNDDRIASMNVRLEKERERLLRDFFRTEEVIAGLQSQQDAIGSIQRITIPE
ncbi:MAG: flagellar filament capping protein FliD [Planctomycetota bacterium]